MKAFRRSRKKRPHTPRKLRLEALEARFVLNGKALLVADAFTVQQNGPQVRLDVLANDSFESGYGGQRLITSVSFGSQGGRLQIAPDKRSIVYTPPADFFGAETFVYAVDGQYTAQVDINIVAPLAFDRYQIPPDGAERTLDVLANDPFWAGYTGAKQITSVSVGSAGGTIRIGANGKSISYTPPDGAFGQETFVYVVDGLYPARVTIDIPDVLEDNKYELVKYEPPAVLAVLANDPFWSGYTGEKKITHVTASQIGATIQISSDGRTLVYTQPADFADRDFSYNVYDSFRYVVDGVFEASVTMILHRPVVDDWFEVDQNSSQFFHNVTANDKYRDESNVVRDVIDRVTAVTQSEKGGTVTISADGKGILYTPAAGFFGDDQFTYIADGAHAARVNVSVSRPVRDDYISNGVYQDTANAILNVLGNDFLGNGYAGPRLITSVGQTEHGGTLTIRADGKAILYTPAAGYTGQDRFTYTVDGLLEAEVTLQVAPLAQPDYVSFYPDPAFRPYTINVLANDYFNRGYVGAGQITAVEIVSGGGQASIQNGQLVFNPAAAGSHTIRYTVDGRYVGTVSVSIHNVAYADQFVVDQNSDSRKFEVLANDFYINYPPYSYPGPRLITSATQSQHGGVVTLSADGRSVHYKPAADFAGEDSFTYTVDDFMTATVTVQVIRRVRDDLFRVDADDGSQTLPVLVNDPFGADYAGPGQITAITSTSAGGTAAVASDGHSIVYQPRAGFVGTETFTYTVDGTQKAHVRIVVDSRDEQAQEFTSLDSYMQFLLDDALARYGHLFGRQAWPFLDPVAFDGETMLTTAGTRGHSETNVQVAGVDEGDIVEFDSDFVYMLTGNELVIVDAWPADALAIASRTTIEGRPIAEFLHGDRLTVISELGGGFPQPWIDIGPVIDGRGWWPVLPSSTIVTVFDVSERGAPKVVQKTTMEGKYVDSRAVNDFVYVLVNNSDAIGPAPQIIDDDNDPLTPGRYETRDEYIARVTASPGEFIDTALPEYSSYGPDGELVRTGLLNVPEDIFRPLVADSRNLISVVSFDIASSAPGVADTSAVYSTGASAIYASLDNFYVFDTDSTREDGAVTRIAKFDWQPATGGIEFSATTTVPGSILNQFSADENGPYLRIATTVSNSYSGNWSGRDENMLFVLREDDGVFEFVGGLQNLALDETMRSVRFLGDRAFVTTFRNIDPLFAIDLSDPARPEAVGHITLPGFTSYMHLVDQNHLLTVGRNTPIGTSGPTQVSLFDITDLLQPLRIAEYTFERFSTSEAELDHHAFGYYAGFGILGMPVQIDRVERVDLDGDGYRETSQSVREHQLAVFSVDVAAANPADRLTLEAEISHETQVRRSGYIGDKLYSIAENSVKAVDLADLDHVVGQVTIPPPPSAPVGPASSPILVIPRLDGNGPQSLLTPPAPIVDPLAASIDRARKDLAAKLLSADGAPLLVTVEATPNSPGGGYTLVFRVGDRYYLYRAGAYDKVQLIDADFHFRQLAGAWNAVDAIVDSSPRGMPGDFNFDGRVDQQDHDLWRANFGSWSLTNYLPADGNRDGTVSGADFALWRANLGAIAGDFNGDHLVDRADYDLWRGTNGSTTDLRADGNHDGVVNGGDFVVWRRAFGDATAAFATTLVPAAAPAPIADRAPPLATGPESATQASGTQGDFESDTALDKSTAPTFRGVNSDFGLVRTGAQKSRSHDEVMHQISSNREYLGALRFIALDRLSREPAEAEPDGFPFSSARAHANVDFSDVDGALELIAQPIRKKPLFGGLRSDR